MTPLELVRYVVAREHPWLRRQQCIHELRGRIPQSSVDALIDCLRDPAEISEVRVALLDVLGDRAELLPWLQTFDSRENETLLDAVLQARAGLGDLTAVRDLVVRAADAWPHRRAVGEAGLDRLVSTHGLDAIEAELDDSAASRRFVCRRRSRAGEDITAALADPDVGVAHVACTLIAESGVPGDETLRGHVATGPTIDARLWAAYALFRRGHDIRMAWEGLGRPRVEVHGLPEDVRGAIVRAYAPEGRCAERVDPRWLVERACLDEAKVPDDAAVEAQLARAMRALESAGLAPRAPRAIGEVNEQGAGSYHVIELGGARVEISALGPFASAEDAPVAARSALEAAGLRWIDVEVARIVVPGLPVYFFGSREPLDVQTLLFYWQD